MSDLNIEVAGGTSVRLLTGGKYCDKNIVVTALGSLTGYRYIRFIINALRGNTQTTQLSELEFIDGFGKVFAYPSEATVTASIGDYYEDENPNMVIDGSVETKFCSGEYVAGAYLQIDLGANGRIDPSVYSRFRWYTANDSPERDPVSFEVRFSNDGINFNTGISVTGATITTERDTLAYTGDCIEGGGSESSRLPSGYTEMEYIESSGTQYIDTGFMPNNNTRVVLDARTTDVSISEYHCVFGCRGGGNFFELFKASQEGWEMTFLYGSSFTNSFEINYDSRHIYEINKNVAKIDDETRSYPATNFQTAYSLYLCATNNSGSALGITPMLIYSSQIYDNDTLVRDFVPCINPNGEYGLYDLANADFYGNAGTGAFTGKVKESGGSEQATPVISVSDNGLITATAGDKSATKQLTTQGAKTVTPSTSEQTAVSSGVYTTGAVKVAAMPTAEQATPAISVDSAGKITASATQAAGYVAAGSKSATKQLTTQGAKEVTPTTTDQAAVASGVYTTGAVVVKGDANLKAENIAEGVSIFGVTGTHAGGGGGNYETATVTVGQDKVSGNFQAWYMKLDDNGRPTLGCVGGATSTSLTYTIEAVKGSMIAVATSGIRLSGTCSSGLTYAGVVSSAIGRYYGYNLSENAAPTGEYITIKID